MAERIGVVPESLPVELLSGGLANQNIRVANKVLRIYRRDPGARRKEARLLQHGWTHFRVPLVHQIGDDFLVLEYVPHDPVMGSAEHGAAVGRALAEIHAMSFGRAGFLGPDLTVETPFVVPAGDAEGELEGEPHAVGEATVDGFRDHVAGQLDIVGAEPARQSIRAVIAILERFHAALRELSATPVLLHGDFKPANLHWARSDELLVLDWEFAYAGPALMDLGQVIRWTPPDGFCTAFAAEYRACGAPLPDDWRRWAQVFDLVNLASMLVTSSPGSRRFRDIQGRIRDTLGVLGLSGADGAL